MPIIIDEQGRMEVTQKQYDAYMAKLPKSKPDFEAIADAEVDRVLAENWYTGIGEVGALASFSNPYQSEAQSMLTWYAEIYHFVELNRDIKTEQEFIDLMPKYSI